MKFHLILVCVGLLCLSFDLAEPNNLTQNTARKILFPPVRDAEGISSLGWLDSGLRCTSRVSVPFFFNPSLSQLDCKGLIQFSVKSKGRLPSIRMGTTWGPTLVMKPKTRLALCG